ncbi:TonB-dependent receptor SusC [bioreactor metagenome]|uniref:TonB-dependent receptor SusC n=1 Tax=bioreactor metagenome TaxID=1076179 RepID=A0A644VIG0_9ZZZZ|nr:TonB-dependent receptor [Paludibacter sp.]
MNHFKIKINFLTVFLFLSYLVVYGQNTTSERIRVKGVVLDNTGESIVGATIKEKGTTQGTVSDAFGHFSMETSVKAVLQVSYVGYMSQEIQVKNQTELRIILVEDVRALSEVVVVGYGVQKKENLTGAVATLDGKAIENRSVSSITQAMQGTIGNLNIAPNPSNLSGDWDSSGGAPGATQKINIRGYTGFDTSGNPLAESPLIVIDGVQGGNINNINMNDVESITVLKDAASSAIYGSSAPFGVILITTKKGDLGQKPTITYSANLMLSQPISLPKMMNSLDYAMAFNQFSDNANTARLYSASTLKRIVDYLNGELKEETLKDLNTDSWLAGFSSNANNDWFDIHFKDVSFSQLHNLGISGGTKSNTYYIGLGYNDQQGMYTYGNDYFKRYNVRTTLQSNLADWLTAGFRGAFSRSERDNPNSATFSNANILHILAQRRPTQPLFNPDGYYSNGSYVNAFRDGGRITTTTDEATLTGEIILHPVKNWNITANYSLTGTYLNRLSHLKTVYHVLPSGKLSTLSGTSPNSISRRADKNERRIVNIFTSYEKSISGHYFKGMVGYMQELYDQLYIIASNNELYSDNILSLATTYGTKTAATDLNEQIATRGVFGRINYNYKEKYLVEFNGRYDGTSRFMKDVRFKFYPGMSVAWALSKERFWTNLLDVVNMFKIRASYGSQGSQGSAGYYPFYPALRTYSSTSAANTWIFSDGQAPMVQFPAGIVDPNLTWVTTNTIDIGTDLSLLSNKLNIGFDWYTRSASDYQGPAEALPSFLGTGAPLTNNAAMKTVGFELNVGWKHRINNFNYGVNVVLSDYSSVITKYPNPTGITITGLGTVYNPMWYEGREFGEIWGFETVGLFQSQEEIDAAADQSLLNAKPWTPGDVRYADLDGDGKITWGSNTLDDPGDRRIIGNSTPRYSFGITLTADYKSFDFSMFLQGVGKRDSPANHNTGEYRFANFVWGVPRQGSYAQTTMWEVQQDRWSQYNTPEENARAFFPKMYFSDENMKNTYEQTRYLQNAAYARIKNIQIGYNLPALALKKLSLQKLRFFINAENMGTWTKMISTLDPEFSTSDGKLYPLQRVWAFGLNVTF